MLTPQEVNAKTFPKAVMGGYTMAAVDDFLDSASHVKKESVSKKKKQITLTISESLLHSVDEAAHELGLSRAAYINAAVSTALKNGLTR